MPLFDPHLRGAVFDLDGTLLDSMWLWGEIDRRFLARRGHDVPKDYLERVKHMDFAHAARYTVERFSLRETPESLIAEWMSMAEASYRKEICFKTGALELVSSMRARGWRVGIATSASPSLFRPTLARCGAEALFDAIVTTEEVGKNKAHPDVYLTCAERLGLAPRECAVFEDILTGIRTAKSAGFFTVAVLDPSSADSNAEMVAEADLNSGDFAELNACFCQSVRIPSADLTRA